MSKVKSHLQEQPTCGPVYRLPAPLRPPATLKRSGKGRSALSFTATCPWPLRFLSVLFVSVWSPQWRHTHSHWPLEEGYLLLPRTSISMSPRSSLKPHSQSLKKPHSSWHCLRICRDTLLASSCRRFRAILVHTFPLSPQPCQIEGESSAAHSCQAKPIESNRSHTDTTLYDDLISTDNSSVSFYSFSALQSAVSVCPASWVIREKKHSTIYNTHIESRFPE